MPISQVLLSEVWAQAFEIAEELDELDDALAEDTISPKEIKDLL